MSVRSLFLTAFSAVLLPSVSLFANDSTDRPLESVRPFLKQYCNECHGANKQENELRFDTLGVDLEDHQTLETWQGILDQLNQGAMPPLDGPPLDGPPEDGPPKDGPPKDGPPEDRPVEKRMRPSAKQVSQVVDLITAHLLQAYAQQKSTGRQTVMRRLNRFELRNTVRDLLYLKGPDFWVDNVSRLIDNNGNGSVANTSGDPFRHFPDDDADEGFDNIGDRLVMSDFFLKLMIDAAEESLELATHATERPAVETRRLEKPIVQGTSQNWGGTLESFQRTLLPGYDAIYRRYHRFARLRPDAFRNGVGTSARYRITIEASAHHQKHPWGEVITTNQDEPLRLGLHVVNRRQEKDSVSLTSWELPDDGEKHTYTFESWIDQDWLPWLGWENGPFHRDVLTERIVEQFFPDQFRDRPDKRDKTKKDEYPAWQVEMAKVALQSGYQGPHIRVYSLTLEPLIDEWPPKSHTSLYGTESPVNADIDELLFDFAQRAYRRPIDPGEITPYGDLVRRLMSESKPDSSGGISGLTYKSYSGTWRKLPDFDSLEPTSAGILSNGLIDIRIAKKNEHYGIVFEGEILASKSGLYEFQVASDDGSRLMVDQKTVVEHDGLHGASTKKGTVQLTAGTHDIRVEYFAFGQPNSLKVRWTQPGLAEESLYVDNKSRPQFANYDAQSMRTIKALQAGYTAILCSPRFLYLQERAGRLDDYEIASRLSYFLWSSMPDDRLIGLAAAGKLRDAHVLQKEVDRMLVDSRAEAFVRSFTIAWLRLDKLGKMPPENGGPFRFYHDRRIEPMMVSQTAAYFADLVEANGPIEALIDSDYTFMNEALANWIYQRDDVLGERMQKVPTNDPRRGGIFTQPSAMTATANGVDTSPVVRGVWVLENVLGTPPSPPPPDVEPLSTDLREAKTIRAQLAAHRDQEACNSCHRKIDPIGFAMENFDPVGRWRDKYPKTKEELDASAVLASGEKIADIVDFKKMLLGEKQLVSRCLTQKLLVYASGREMEPADRGEVDAITAKLESAQGGLRDLIKLIVQSEIFLTK